MRRIKRTQSLDRNESLLASKSEESNTQYPQFDLSLINKGKFPLSDCNDEEKAAFADKLAELSQLSWQQLTQAPRHGLGFEKIDYYQRPAIIPQDVSILAFRFCGKAAMLGFRYNRIFTVIELDRAFKAYDHE